MPTNGQTAAQTVAHVREGLPPHRRIYTNRNLRMSSIQAIGFDMDHTLAVYNEETFSRLCFDLAIDLLAADERVQEDPAPMVFVETLGSSSVDIAAWPFVHPENYLPFRYEIVEKGKLRLEEAGMTIPFPQRDVHFYREVAQSDDRV